MPSDLTTCKSNSSYYSFAKDFETKLQIISCQEYVYSYEDSVTPSIVQHVVARSIYHISQNVVQFQLVFVESGRVFYPLSARSTARFRGRFIVTINTPSLAWKGLDLSLQANTISYFSQRLPTLLLSLSNFSLDFFIYSIHYTQNHTCLSLQISYNWYQEPQFYPRISGVLEFYFGFGVFGWFEPIYQFSHQFRFVRCFPWCFSCTFLISCVISSQVCICLKPKDLTHHLLQHPGHNSPKQDSCRLNYT